MKVTLLGLVLRSGADPGFFLRRGGAPLRNGVTDWKGKLVFKANTKKASSVQPEKGTSPLHLSSRSALELKQLYLFKVQMEIMYLLPNFKSMRLDQRKGNSKTCQKFAAWRSHSEIKAEAL